MAFPITIDATAMVCEAPGYFGPFQAGTSLYAVCIDPNTQQLLMFKSVDSGVTWAVVDSAGGPIAALNIEELSSVYYSACQSTADTNKIFVVYTDVNLGNELALVTFNAGTDTWGVPSDSGQFYNGFHTLVCCYRASDDSVIVVGDNQQVETFFIFHNICSYTKYNVGAGTWNGTWTALGSSDYSDATVWNQQPSGICVDSSGTIHVFMQQITQRSSQLKTLLFDFNSAGVFTFDIPGDCTEIDLYVIGAGGGGGGTGGSSGGGGGGGITRALAHPVTPGSTINITVGAGGPVDTDGEDSAGDGVTAGGGKKGGGTLGGVGGTGTSLGGDGGATDGGASGGGGGASGYYITPLNISSIIGGGSVGAGQAGGDSSGTTPGTGGQPPFLAVGGVGGTGGRNIANGGAGTPPGAGGGGGGSAHLPGVGGDGEVIAFYTPITNEHAGRLWHQSLSSSDALGTLQEITEGSFPLNGGPIPFDCKPGVGYVAIAFSGSTASTNATVSVGRASNGADLTFSFKAVTVSNSNSGISPSPAIVISGTTVVCFYLQVTDISTCEFFYQSDGGAGFGGATSLGVFLDIGCRMCVTVFSDNTIGGAFGQSAQAEMLPTGVV